MEINEEQKKAVREWLAKGATLSDVQKNLKEQFGIGMTYMDVRLLVLDIGAAVQDKPEPKPPKPPKQEPPEEADPYADEDEPAEGEAPVPPPDGAPASKVSVTLDKIVVPGAMVSGNVAFSDGVTARWMIDQTGRFGIEPSKPGYQPSQADMRAFQASLRAELQRAGY
jgi:hypothetical protein